jgi:hypothetical protein
MIAEALQNLRPGSKWYIENGVYEGIVWLEENISSKPSKQEILDEVSRLESLQYKDKRIKEYPSIGDQLDALFKAGLFPEEMAAKIQAIKEKYPKG